MNHKRWKKPTRIYDSRVVRDIPENVDVENENKILVLNISKDGNKRLAPSKQVVGSPLIYGIKMKVKELLGKDYKIDNENLINQELWDFIEAQIREYLPHKTQDIKFINEDGEEREDYVMSVCEVLIKKNSQGHILVLTPVEDDEILFIEETKFN